MADQEIVDALKQALLEPVKQEPLPRRRTKGELFALGVAGAVDPDIQERFTDPALAEVRGRSKLKFELEEKAKAQQISQLESVFNLETLQAREGRAQSAEERAQLEAQREESARSLQSNIFQSTLSSLPLILEQIETAAQEADEKISPNRGAYLRGLGSELEFSLNSLIGQDGMSVEDPDGELQKKFAEYVEGIDDTIRDTFNYIEKKELSDDEINDRIERAKLDRQPIPRSPEQVDADVALAEQRRASAELDKAKTIKELASEEEKGIDAKDRLPPNITTDLAMRKSLLVGIDGVRAQIMDAASRLGINVLAGRLGAADIKRLRAELTNLGASIQKDIFGATVPEGERELADQFIPFIRTFLDAFDIPSLLGKLDSMRDGFARQHTTQIKAFQQEGRFVAPSLLLPLDSAIAKGEIPEGSMRLSGTRNGNTIVKTPDGKILEITP